jgi:hypothetical protein
LADIIDIQRRRKAAMLEKTAGYFRALEEHLQTLGEWPLETADELREAADILRQMMTTGRESATLARMVVEVR